MLKFECKCGNRWKCLKLREKGEIDQMLIFFIAKVGINQNVGIWLKNKELIRILKFEYNKVGSIKMLKFEWKRGDWSNVDILLPKWELIKMLEFNWKIRKWSEYWNLRTTLRIDQNVIIWVQNVKSIKMLKFEWKGKIDQYVKFEWKGGNQ